jgi:hypothetical protein
MRLLEDLAILVGHYHFQLHGTLELDVPLNREACVLIGHVSQLFSRIDFGWSCITMKLSIDFSKDPLICLDLMKSPVEEQHARIISDMLRVNGNTSGGLKIDIDRPLAAPAKSLEILIEEIGKSEMSELTFGCFDEELYALILTNACNMKLLDPCLSPKEGAYKTLTIMLRTIYWPKVYQLRC